MDDKSRAPKAAAVRYRIIRSGVGFAIETDGILGTVPYVTKEAAWEALAATVDSALAENAAIEISIPPGPGSIA
jgi:hypothetical protein